MLKKYSVFIFFLLTTVFGLGQTKEIDSLRLVLRTSQDSEKKADAYQRLGWLTIRKDLQAAKKYVDSAVKIYKTIGNANEVVELNYKYAVINRYEGNFDKALEHINIFLEYVKKEGKPENIANGSYQKGVIYEQKGNYEKSLEQHYVTLKIYEDIGNSTSIGFTLNSIGIVHGKLKQFKQAEKSFLRAVDIHLKENDDDNLANVYSSLGSLNGDQGEDEEAIKYFQKCLELDLKSGNQWAIASDYQNIGISYTNLDQHLNGIEYFNKALKIQEENGFNSDMAFVMMSLGEAYLKIEDLEGAENILLNALKLDLDALQTRKDVHRNLAKVYKEKLDFKNSYRHLELYSKLKDSIFNEEDIKNINELRFQYETEKKDKEIAEQQLVLADQRLSIQESNSKTRTMTILIVSLLLGSILLWFSFRQRQKRMQQQLVAIEREQELRTLESLMEGEEKERFRIAKELHDGVNGDLSAIKFKLVSLLETNNKVINEAVTMIDTSCEQVRAISHNLVPPSLRDFNLIEAVESYCESMNAIHDPEIIFQHLGEDIVLEKKQEANLFRIVQELVANSVKHARAKEIHVQLSNVEDNVQLTVEDDGKGFDVASVSGDGIGMQNVKSRVDYLGGLMDIKSDAKGTSFTITIADKPEKK